MAEDVPSVGEEGRVCVGVVTGAHGVKGLVRIKPFTEMPEGIAAYGTVETEDGSRQLEITVANRIGKGQIAARIAGIRERTAAEALKGQRLYVPRARLPAPAENEFYHADLIGLAVLSGDGRRLGAVRAVYDFGAGDVLEIADATGNLSLVPFNRQAVPEIDIAAGSLIVADGYLGDSNEE